MVETNNSINGCLCLLTQICEGVLSGFSREVYENCALLGYYAVVTISYLVFLTREDGADKLSRNVGKKLPLLAA
jgi:hypothetical protein